MNFYRERITGPTYSSCCTDFNLA